MSDESEPPEPPSLPSAAELCIQRPLYAPYEVPNTHNHKHELYTFVASGFQIDTFCPWCGQPTVLLGGKQEVNYQNFSLRDQLFEKSFFCSRKHDHEFVFYFKLEDRKLIKIGQFPSMADIEQGVIQQYRPVLDKSHYQELNRALGLAAHGVGIGSFVYLRRIFERLVDEAYEKAKGDPEWNDEAYQRARMDEKIGLLKHHLPEFLVEQKALYGILSQGVHSLDEETCLAHFPVIRTGIELILDQKLAMDQQKKKMAEAKKQIGQLTKQLKKD